MLKNCNSKSKFEFFCSCFCSSALSEEHDARSRWWGLVYLAGALLGMDAEVERYRDVLECPQHYKPTPTTYDFTSSPSFRTPSLACVPHPTRNRINRSQQRTQPNILFLIGQLFITIALQQSQLNMN